MLRRVKEALKHRTIKLLGYLAKMQQRIVPCYVNGQVILLDVQSELEQFRASTYATKEPETLEWIERYFKTDDVLYDVGANIGLYSLYAARVLKGRCQIYAFEPEALNHAKLNQNIFLNGFSGQITPCCLALTETLGFDRLYLNPECFQRFGQGQDQGLAPGGAMHNFGAAKDFQGESFRPIHEQGMLGVPLDRLWKEWGFDFPTHIKIDVDGLEEEVIAGADETIRDPRLKSVLVEISVGRSGKHPIIDLFASAGFDLIPPNDFSAHSNDKLKGGRYEGCQNHIFVRPD